MLPLLLAACGMVVSSSTSLPDGILNQTANPSPTSSPVPTPFLNTIHLQDNHKFDIRSCPFFECARVYQFTSSISLEAIGYDGRSKDPQDGQVWLQVVYEGEKSGWLYLSPDRIVIPEGLLDRLPVGQWSAPTALPILPTPTGDPAFIIKTLCISNVYDTVNINPNPGKTLRFRTPIQINTGGIALVTEAIQKIEADTDGLVTFEEVDHDPEVGITVDVGDSLNMNGTPGDGNVTPGRDPKFSGRWFKTGEDGYANSLVFVHLGSLERSPFVQCPICETRTSITEHEIAHAIGLGWHFADFMGGEGFSYNVILVIKYLYGMPSGTDMTGICPPN